MTDRQSTDGNVSEADGPGPDHAATLISRLFARNPIAWRNSMDDLLLVYQTMLSGSMRPSLRAREEALNLRQLAESVERAGGDPAMVEKARDLATRLEECYPFVDLAGAVPMGLLLTAEEPEDYDDRPTRYGLLIAALAVGLLVLISAGLFGYFALGH